MKSLTNKKTRISKQVRVIILFTAGTNCDQETKFAFEKAGAKVDTIHINELKRNPKSLKEYQILVIPGGFTYGDYIAAGKILANELRFSLRSEIEDFLNQGKLILGICNGFQVLVKAGILPGLNGYFSEPEVTLDVNDSNRFEDRWIFLKTRNAKSCVWTKNLPEIITLPVAHGEGKFLTKSRSVLNKIYRNHCVALIYVDANGNKAGYPYNPNGSIGNIAGICDKTGRVFGLMPHPERFSYIEQHPFWHNTKITEPDGLLIFKNGVQYARENL